jgi:peptidoglycan/LPS O-acetylase OafA/YrhL
MPATTARLIAALSFYGSPFYAFLISTTLLAMVLRSDPLHAAGGWLLASPPFKAAAKMSYSVYLVHEMVKVLIVMAAPAALAAWIQQEPVGALHGLIGATLAGSYVAGWLSWRLIEQRF